MDNKHPLLKIENRPTDWKFGDGNIKFTSNVPSANWVSHLWFNENQDLTSWGDTNGCVLFTISESLDCQMDYLISTGKIPLNVLAQFQAMGFMDSINSTDNLPHFHSSPRFLEVKTGNKTAGNSVQEGCDALRQFGILPWVDCPYDAQLSEAEYFAPMTSAQLSKAAQFLSLIGGKSAIQYHQLTNDSPKNIPQMVQALQQAPLAVGIAVAENWNQVIPSPDPTFNALPQHCVMNYAIVRTTLSCLDHYSPYEKVLDSGYPVNYVSQLVVSPIIPPPLPVPLPPNPTVQQESSWIQSISNWIQNIINQIQGRNNLGSTTMNYDIFKSRTFWSAVVTIAYNFFATVVPLYPNVPWVSTVFDLLGFISVSYFHIQGVQKAAISSAALQTPSSGQ